MNKNILFLCFFAIQPFLVSGQCLSSVNPVGGTDNLLVLEKQSLRVISFYRYGQGSGYFEGSSHSEYNLINKAYYNYLSTIIGYGLTNKLTLEIETGYFINKTQDYNLIPAYSLTGRGLSNAVFIAKQSFLNDHSKRFYITGSAGAKIPFSQELQQSDHVILPVEVQPTIGAYGLVFSTTAVKEDSGTGMRYFLTSRAELSDENKNSYRSGSSVFTSIYLSKHLRRQLFRDKWTAIMQLRHEYRSPDKVEGRIKKSSGSTLFFISPQLNYVIHNEWNLSALADFPVHQSFRGIQQGAGTGFSFIISRTFMLSKSN
jgi:hypothetical protein